jgi:CDP-glucose 4,6-dehydratase
MDKIMWQDRPVFITGATGLLGGWLVKRLIELDANIVCLVRDWIPQSMVIKDLVSKVKIVRGEICDQSLIERILGEYEIDIVFNLAAQTIVGIANRNPISTFESNIKGTWIMMEACRRSPKFKCVIQSSSDKCYGDSDDLPYRENLPLQGIYPYDLSKVCADLVAQSYAKVYGLPVCITRCGNFYGGGDLNFNRIVPDTIRSIIRGKQPVIRSNGTLIRDYFYIEDGVEAYLLLAEKLLDNPKLKGEAFNFSNNQPLAVYQIVDLITALMDSHLLPIIKNEASNEIKEQYLDSAKAMELLGWQPHYSIEQGLINTINWYRDYFDVGK